MKYFYEVSTIFLGIVVSALAFHPGGPGSIPWLGKSSNKLFLLLPIAITKPSSLDQQPLKSLKLSPLKELLRENECQLQNYLLDIQVQFLYRICQFSFEARAIELLNVNPNAQNGLLTSGILFILIDIRPKVVFIWSIFIRAVINHMTCDNFVFSCALDHILKGQKSIFQHFTIDTVRTPS